MRYLITCILILTASFSFSQDSIPDNLEVRNYTVEFNGGKYNGYIMELNASPEIVEAAVKERFKLQGSKLKETNRFLVYRNVVLPAIDAYKTIDAFIKVERKSRKEKDQTVVYLIAANPGAIPEEKVKTADAAKYTGTATIAKGDDFLKSLQPDIKQGVYNSDLSDKQDALKKEEKKLLNLQDDLSDMEKKLKKLESDIESNKKAQEKQLADLERLRQELNELISKNPSGKTQ